MKKYNVSDYEKEFAKRYIEQGFCYIARDENGFLYAHKTKPIKCPFPNEEGEWIGTTKKCAINPALFKEVVWEDNKPAILTDMLYSFEYKSDKELVDKMVRDIPSEIVAYDNDPKGQHLYGEQRQQIAQVLCDKGYRNQKDVISEFVYKLNTILAPHRCQVGDGDNIICYLADCEHLDDKIAQLAKEYGVEVK